ncbi:uncharacterized protein A4U43_C08F12640 [Asparagus officinalis]|nr:uncharacterized protein A4U43_C08F12640 [Asparagus officinalis]
MHTTSVGVLVSTEMVDGNGSGRKQDSREEVDAPMCWSLGEDESERVTLQSWACVAKIKSEVGFNCDGHIGDKEFGVAIKYAGHADLHHLQQFLHERQLDAPQEQCKC